MVLYTLDELREKGITELKKIANELGIDIQGYSKSNKDDLARKISRSKANKEGVPGKKSSRRTPRKTSRRRVSRKRTPRRQTSSTRRAKRTTPEKTPRRKTSETKGSDIYSMNVAQLKAHVKALGIKGYSTKKKDELIKMIESHTGKRPAPSAKPSKKPSTDKAEQDLSKMTVVQLKEFAKNNGISLTGKSGLKKAELIAYIKSQLSGKDVPGTMPKPTAPKPSKAKKSECKSVNKCKDTSTKLTDIREIAEACGLNIRDASGKLKNRKIICDEIEKHIKSQKETEEVSEEEPVYMPPEVEVEEVSEEEEPVHISPEVEEVSEEEEPVYMPPEVEEVSEEEEPVYMPPEVEEEEPVYMPPEVEEEPELSEKDRLMKMTLKELRDMIKSEGIAAPVGLSKNELIDEYLLGERCDPETDEMCPEDKICDIRPLPEHKGICISSKRSPKGLSEFIYRGKKIVGSVEAIQALREKLEPKPKSKPETKSKPEPKIPSEDIEEVLREVKGSEDLGDLSELQEQVLKCFGLST
jgi:hypothetical protein